MKLYILMYLSLRPVENLRPSAEDVQLLLYTQIIYNTKIPQNLQNSLLLYMTSCFVFSSFFALHNQRPHILRLE